MRTLFVPAEKPGFIFSHKLGIKVFYDITFSFCFFSKMFVLDDELRERRIVSHRALLTSATANKKTKKKQEKHLFSLVFFLFLFSCLFVFVRGISFHISVVASAHMLLVLTWATNPIRSFRPQR